MCTQAVIAPPAVEPVSVGEMKLWMRLDEDTIEDSLIAEFIATARVAAELFTGRAFITQSWKMTLAGFSRRSGWAPGYYELPVDYFDGTFSDCLELPTEPVQSVTSITTYSSENVGILYPAPNYTLLGRRITLNPGYSWPSPLRTASPAEIVYVAGYGDEPRDVPAPIRTAIKMHAAMMYESRCSCDMPPQCEQLLRQYRIARL